MEKCSAEQATDDNIAHAHWMRYGISEFRRQCSSTLARWLTGAHSGRLKLCSVAPNVFGFSVWNLIFVTPPTPSFFEATDRFLQNCGLLPWQLYAEYLRLKHFSLGTLSPPWIQTLATHRKASTSGPNDFVSFMLAELVPSTFFRSFRGFVQLLTNSTVPPYVDI